MSDKRCIQKFTPYSLQLRKKIVDHMEYFYEFKRKDEKTADCNSEKWLGD